MRKKKSQLGLLGSVLLVALAALLGCQQAAPPAAQPRPRSTTQRTEQIRAERHPELQRAEVADDQVAKNLREGKPPYAHLMGYTPQPAQSERFIRSMPRPTLKEAAPDFFQARGPPPARYAADEPILLYRALNVAHQRKFGSNWSPIRQEIGDCVSHGWSLACTTRLAIDYVLGESGDFQVVFSEAVYGLSRVEGRGVKYNGGGDGSYGSAAAAGVTKFGVPFRLDYTNVASSECDGRTYSGSRARNWGAYGCGGRSDEGRLDAIAKLHPVGQVALITTWEETVAAIRNGYAIAVCSGQGFAYATDRDGFARPQGSWAHCMCAFGVRFDREGVLIANSWGSNWIDQSGGKYPSDMPPGCFWCDRRVWERMIAGRDTYAVATVKGFQRTRLRLVEGL